MRRGRAGNQRGEGAPRRDAIGGFGPRSDVDVWTRPSSPRKEFPELGARFERLARRRHRQPSRRAVNSGRYSA